MKYPLRNEWTDSFLNKTSQNSHSQSDIQTLKIYEVISNSDIKPLAHQHQPLSSHHHHCMTTHYYHQAPWPMPICGPTPGQPGQPQQSQAPPPHHLFAATPTLPISSTTIKTTTMTQEGWRSVRKMGRRGTGGQKDNNDAVCNPHTGCRIK